MERAISFKSFDGSLHSDKISCLKQDLLIQMKGLIQTKVGTGVAANTLTPTQVARVLSDNLEDFYQLVSKSRDQMRRNLPKQTASLGPQ